MPALERISAEDILFYTELVCEILRDVYAGTKLRLKDLYRDQVTIRKRSLHRGLPFLTRELPSLGKAVLRALETGHLELPSSFGRKKGTRLPGFMPGIFRCVFHGDGLLLPDPDPYALQEILQVCFIAYKLQVPSSQADEEKVLRQFLDTEDDLRDLWLFPSFSEDGAVLNEASRLLDDVLMGFNPKDIIPRHGPGSVSTGEKYNAKYIFDRSYERLHQFYPYETFFTGGGVWAIWEQSEGQRQITAEPYGSAKIVFVPKDSRGPRLISCEPLSFQWIQGGLNKALVSHIESCPLTRGLVNFTDQTVNQNLALAASRDGAMATLDLKEASDRVSTQLVERIWPARLVPYLLATRSERTLIPEGHRENFGDDVTLLKFAPMGSSLCFPVLALTLWAIVTALTLLSRQSDVHWYEERLVSDSPVSSVRDCRVHVYGDDLIVPTSSAESVLAFLPKVGLKVNTDKSFYSPSSRFRESCGMDAFNGIQVTPLRLKELYTSSRAHMSGNAYASYVALANAFFRRGYWNTYDYLRRGIEKAMGRPIPHGVDTTAYPCIIVDDPRVAETLNSESCSRRWNADYQRWEYKVPTLVTKNVRSPIDGWPRLLKNFSELHHGPHVDDHGTVPWNPLSSITTRGEDWAQQGVVPRLLKIAARYNPV